MRNKVVKMILNAFLSVLPLLFLYGVVVNVATFYQGITSSWITLFTMMTCSGALLLRVLLQYLFREQGMDYEKKMTATGILGIFGLVLDIRVGLFLLACNGLDCFLYQKKKQDLCMMIFVCVTVAFCNYAFTKGWINITQYMFYLFTEIEYVCMYKVHEIDISNKEIQHSRKKLVLSTFLNIVKNICMFSVFTIACRSMIHIFHEDALFQQNRMCVYLLITSIIWFITSYVQEKKKLRNALSQRISILAVICIFGCMMMQSSLIVCSLFLMGGFAVVALEILLGMYGKQMNHYSIAHVFVLVILLGSRAAYDGIYVNYSVILISIYMIEAYACMYITMTNEKDVEEKENGN